MRKKSYRLSFIFINNSNICYGNSSNAIIIFISEGNAIYESTQSGSRQVYIISHPILSLNPYFVVTCIKPNTGVWNQEC